MQMGGWMTFVYNIVAMFSTVSLTLPRHAGLVGIRLKIRQHSFEDEWIRLSVMLCPKIITIVLIYSHHWIDVNKSLFIY
jgi:hypothetical protein